eukprot:TRINITY_DN117_c0_g1_i3.p1 TRINITY_DN117_c0_g1~~TRINITY_DN117_c0_g1_i3.p1  ORF type:complete len:327 (+),score=83.56 TRINITY_DN117_c0_g1_i3:61-981(+)
MASESLLKAAGALDDQASTCQKGAAGMTLFVRVNEQTIPVDVGPDDTVGAVVKQVKDILQMDPSLSASLQFGDEMLTDMHALLSDVGVGSESVLCMNVANVHWQALASSSVLIIRHSRYGTLAELYLSSNGWWRFQVGDEPRGCADRGSMAWPSSCPQLEQRQDLDRTTRGLISKMKAEPAEHSLQTLLEDSAYVRKGRWLLKKEASSVLVTCTDACGSTLTIRFEGDSMSWSIGDTAESVVGVSKAVYGVLSSAEAMQWRATTRRPDPSGREQPSPFATYDRAAPPRKKRSPKIFENGPKKCIVS